MSRLTYEDVIEEHKKAKGLKDMHVTLGPGATPEALREELKNIDNLFAEFETFSEIEKLKARIDALTQIIKKISKLGPTTVEHWLSMAPSEHDLRVQINTLTEFYDTVDISAAIKFMKSKR